ncbi:MAG: hypothetical protein CSB44_12270 [Gammaproteobacteria bacterium]|nr:MAG: hypothetical protein CSB44_12270 [Gammaproteobacteria bacterium]
MRNRIIHVALAALLTVLSQPARTLELGLEGYLGVEGSDNIDSANPPLEEDGSLLTGIVGIYGEQRGQKLQAGFVGELETRRRLDRDDEFDSLSRFLGAAEFTLSPRRLYWYAGDILAGVRADDAFQPIDDADTVRRNVFVTGPRFTFDTGPDQRIEGRLFYVDQSEADEPVDDLVNFSTRWVRDTLPGSFFGFRLNDVYTLRADDDADDVNRMSILGFWNRQRGVTNLYGELGATRYAVDDDSLDGFSALLSAKREIGPASSVSVTLWHDLTDQSLSTVESIIGSGANAIGVQPESSGYFNHTRLEAAYGFDSRRTSFDVGGGYSVMQYEQLFTGLDAVDPASEDRDKANVWLGYGRHLSARWRISFGSSYERQTYDNRADESESLLFEGSVFYRLNRSLELGLSLAHDRAEGTRTRGDMLETVDTTENRFGLGLRWAPPSRASKELTIELKSLLQ